MLTNQVYFSIFFIKLKCHNLVFLFAKLATKNYSITSDWSMASISVVVVFKEESQIVYYFKFSTVVTQTDPHKVSYKSLKEKNTCHHKNKVGYEKR